MALEAATFIDDLITTNPVTGDGVAQGDDHLRLLKAVLKGTFPNLAYARYVEQPRVDVADSATPALWAAASNYVNLLGTTAKTGFASGTEGQTKIVRLDAVMTLTHHATTLDLPGGANITTAAGDHMLVTNRNTTSNKVIAYFRNSGKAVAETFTLPVTDDVGKFLKATSVGVVAYVQVEPVGFIGIWPNSTPPTGWLECNGQTVLRSTPLGIFLDGDYGPGDGVTTYNVPDLRGEFIRGWDHGRTADPDSADRTDRGDGTVGDNIGTKQTDMFESHFHTTNIGRASTDGPNATIRNSSASFGDASFNSDSKGGDETRPRNVNMMFIIKT